jgi:Carboxypeptidase regulatory-like domain
MKSLRRYSRLQSDRRANPGGRGKPVQSVVMATVLALLFAGMLSAADLSGTVTYKTSGMSRPEALPSALVSIYDTATQRKTVTRTNGVGAYLFRNLPGGSYIVVIEKDGRRVYQGKVVIPTNRPFDIAL